MGVKEAGKRTEGRGRATGPLSHPFLRREAPSQEQLVQPKDVLFSRMKQVDTPLLPDVTTPFAPSSVAHWQLNR
jgi:hypothetical protein